MESVPKADPSDRPEWPLEFPPQVDEKIMDRGQWSNKLEFVLSVAGGIIGLGNVWRFPYLCYKNGGGAFLIPYFIFLFTCGFPLFFLETSLGQFTSEGAVTSWRKICPLFEGHCRPTDFILRHCPGLGDILPLVLLLLGPPLVLMQQHLEHRRRALRISPGIEQMGELNWDLALCLLAAWVVCYFCIWKGIKSSGKVVYFTATFPYVMLTVLLIRGVTLPGASQGIKFYLYPDLGRLVDPQVWVDAGTQVIFSFAICQGYLTALGSYNKYNNNCYRDSLALCFLNCGTSFIAGFVIFSILGFMSYEQNVPISQVAQSGPGLAFIVYPPCRLHDALPSSLGLLLLHHDHSAGLDSHRILHLTKPSIDLPKTNKEKDKLLAIFDPSCDGHPQQAPPPKDSHLQVSMTELYH
ncbi:hypothetical protein SKAU_G00035450 [Synaphobranchus kaupii]|uniref:Transporter n=1 Tax=Synaphobranchus kaupii TaxID=118154 RepID=A0A9Q1JGJ0_SYNKA|nr:hypothetical protein SKAU_G00035450 [Synaphobranchus kaupii]